PAPTYKRNSLLSPPPKLHPLRLQPQPLRATLLATLPPADTSRLLKKSASGVLASFKPSMSPRGYDSALHSLRPCMGQDASWRARIGRVRNLAFLNSLRVLLKPSMTSSSPVFLVSAT